MSPRINFCPTHSHAGFELRIGNPVPFGASPVPEGVNFSIFSSHATACTLVLFKKGTAEPMVEIPFPECFRIGNVFCMVVFDLEFENIEYGYRMDGPNDPQTGHRFDKTRILLDPYAKAVGGRDLWSEPPAPDNPFQHRGRLIIEDFDWGDDHPLEIPIEDLVIYEMHVRGFTKHPSSGVKHPGTYAGIIEKIPYLKDLGINCVELMPVFEFDELENIRTNPATGQPLLNYWGYSTIGFFAPKAGYAAGGKTGMQVDEFKNLIKQLHKNGIEVILDVVFNHTAEGNENGPIISFRGIDNKTYYMLMPDGRYYNFSGCGNTLNCNHPIVRDMVKDCLRYWVSEYHIDGFRFDLASILGRDPEGNPLSNPPLLESLAFDPVLAECKLIAEAWDAGGLYQVGSFPAYHRWAEWNGRYRDEVRQFLIGHGGMVSRVALRLQGSPDLYGNDRRGPAASINFITCHDGFTLRDLFSYDQKQNQANGEDNLDGSDFNYSWNCGAEGETDDPEINDLRQRLMKNAVAILMVSHGVPMILMGDEVGRTQMGNNNPYCHDNEISWLDWRLVERNQDLYRFARNMIAFRMAHPVLRPEHHLRNEDYVKSGYPDISWHGTTPWHPDLSDGSRFLAFLLCGRHARGGKVRDNSIYVAMNMSWEASTCEFPPPPAGENWYLAVDTGKPAPEDIFKPGTEPEIGNSSKYLINPRSVIIAISR